MFVNYVDFSSHWNTTHNLSIQIIKKGDQFCFKHRRKIYSCNKHFPLFLTRGPHLRQSQRRLQVLNWLNGYPFPQSYGAWSSRILSKIKATLLQTHLQKKREKDDRWQVIMLRASRRWIMWCVAGTSDGHTRRRPRGLQREIQQKINEIIKQYSQKVAAIPSRRSKYHIAGFNGSLKITSRLNGPTYATRGSSVWISSPKALITFFFIKI